jgi:hypothetical protein
MLSVDRETGKWTRSEDFYYWGSSPSSSNAAANRVQVHCPAPFDCPFGLRLLAETSLNPARQANNGRTAVLD